MRLLLYLAVALPTTIALFVPRLESQSLSERHLVPRVFRGDPGETEPILPKLDPNAHPGEAPVRPPDDTEFILPHLDVGPPFSHEFPEFISPKENAHTGLTSPDGEGTSDLHIANTDKQVKSVLSKFTEGEPWTRPEEPPPVILYRAARLPLDGDNNANSRSKNSRRRDAVKKWAQKVFSRNPAPPGENAIANKVPQGQKNRLAVAMAGLKDAFRIKRSTEPIPEDMGGPYMHGALGRRNVIPNGEEQGSSDQKNSTNNLKEQFQAYSNAYYAVQANITKLIVPSLAPFVKSTKDSMMLDIAWSVFHQLTGSDVVVAGPFMYGMHCMDTLEEEYFSTHNISSNATEFDDTTTQYLAYHQVLLDTYTSVLDNATAAVNQTGLLRDLAILTTYLTPTDPSIAPDGWYTDVTGPNKDSFFEAFGLQQIQATTSSS